MPRALLLVVLAAPAALAFSTFDGIQYVNTFWEIWEKGEETAFKATYSPGLQFEIPAVGVNITGINNVWTLRQGIEGNGNGDLRTLEFPNTHRVNLEERWVSFRMQSVLKREYNGKPTGGVELHGEWTFHFNSEWVLDQMWLHLINSPVFGVASSTRPTPSSVYKPSNNVTRYSAANPPTIETDLISLTNEWFEKWERGERGAWLDLNEPGLIYSFEGGSLTGAEVLFGVRTNVAGLPLNQPGSGDEFIWTFFAFNHRVDLVNRYVTTSPWLYIKSDSEGLNASQVIEQAHMVFKYSADWKVEQIQFFPYYSYISGDRNPPPTATVPFAPSPFLLAAPLAVTGSDVIVRVNDFFYDLEFGRQAEVLAALADDVVVDMPDISISTSGPTAFWTDYRMALANSAANDARGGASEFYWQEIATGHVVDLSTRSVKFHNLERMKVASGSYALGDLVGMSEWVFTYDAAFRITSIFVQTFHAPILGTVGTSVETVSSPFLLEAGASCSASADWCVLGYDCIGGTCTSVQCASWCNSYTCGLPSCAGCDATTDECAQLEADSYCAGWCNEWTCGFEHCEGCSVCQATAYCLPWCNAYTCATSWCSDCSVCADVAAGSYCASWCNSYTCGFSVCAGCGVC
mmetsp:Transcript_40165/g.99569  ORF Transcript_40165/g.99569 Transcript_40165/m.99569 type:complete len:633 (-) Transcript_40165:491-2389(-)